MYNNIVAQQKQRRVNGRATRKASGNARARGANKLKNLDKYYTKASAVQTCLSALRGRLQSFDLVVEPAAGAGAFADAIQHKNKIAIDISPDAPGIKRADWFSYSLPQNAARAAVVGNPPFGKANVLSREFLLRAFSFPNVRMVAFVLPDVYNKHTQQRILPAGWRISNIVPLGESPFTLGGGDFHIPCSFFVFEKTKGRDLRFDPAKHKEAVDFRWGAKNDFDLFMFGAAPRKVTEHPTPNNRGHFLKAKISVKELARRIQSVDWRGNSCASGGVFWLTKSEVVAQYNAHYG